MKFLKKIGFLVSLICSFFRHKTEFQEITDMKKIFKELASFPTPKSEILEKIQAGVAALNEQNNIVEDSCPVCWKPTSIFSSDGVLLICGHELCRKCFLDPMMQKCPQCRAAKAEYSTKFEELTRKKKLQKKSKHRNKLEQEISIKETECEVLRYVLAQKPKEPIRKLVKSEMKKCDLDHKLALVPNSHKQKHFAVQEIEKCVSFISKYCRLFWQLRCFTVHIFNQFTLDSLENWRGSLYLTQMWMFFQEIGTDKNNMPNYFVLSNYIIAFDFIVLKFILGFVLDRLYDVLFWSLEGTYFDTRLFRQHHRQIIGNKKTMVRKFFKSHRNAEHDIFYFIYLGIFDALFLAFGIGKNSQILPNVFFSVILNGELHIQSSLIFGSLGFSISAILNAFPDWENFILRGIPLIYVAITIFMLFSTRKYLIDSLLIIAGLSLILSAMASLEKLESANSESLELIEKYFHVSNE